MHQLSYLPTSQPFKMTWRKAKEWMKNGRKSVKLLIGSSSAQGTAHRPGGCWSKGPVAGSYRPPRAQEDSDYPTVPHWPVWKRGYSGYYEAEARCSCLQDGSSPQSSQTPAAVPQTSASAQRAERSCESPGPRLRLSSSPDSVSMTS